MKRTVNVFQGGVDRDTADNDLEPFKLRDAKNIRILSFDGKGKIAVSIKGNTLAFSLPDGFVPLGAAEYQGIAYIFSYNAATSEGQVGTYPSPDYAGGSGWLHQYTPLQNWTGANDPSTQPPPADLPFTTTLLDISCPDMLQVEACLSYDNSVNLYFADGVSPLRRINSGFDHKTGAKTGQKYWTGNFFHQVNAFFETCPHPKITPITVLPGGQFPTGNTIFYFRYANTNFDRTSFLGESRPVMLYTEATSAQALIDGEDYNPDSPSSGKKIELTIVDVDPSMAYVEVAYLHYEGNTEEYRLIDQPYAIPAGATTLTITITGQEPVVDLIEADLISRKITADVPKTITQHENRLWGANWKESLNGHTELKAIAEKLIATPALPSEMYTMPMPHWYGSGAAHQYKDYNRVMDHVGYFRGETYSFGIVFVFKDGKESRAYPVRGYDAWLNTALITTPAVGTPGYNTRGNLRFPSNRSLDPFTPADSYSFMRNSTGSWQIHVMGVKFDTSQLVVDQWMTDNLCGFYFVRAEREPNLIVQGHVSNSWTARDAADGTILVGPPGTGIGSSDGHTFTPYQMAEFNYGNLALKIPVFVKDDCGAGFTHYYKDSDAPVQVKANRYGLFSSDHFLSSNYPEGTYYMVKQGDALHSDIALAGTFTVPCRLYLQDSFTPSSGALNAANGYGQIMTVEVEENQVWPNQGFVSRFERGSPTATGHFYSAWNNTAIGGCVKEFSNREIKQRRYVGILTDQGAAEIALNTSLTAQALINSVINVYRYDPVSFDVEQAYSPQTEYYYRISEFIKLADIGAVPATVFYRGDCFIQRTYHRHMADFGTEPTLTDNDTSDGPHSYRYGMIVSQVQECTANVSMRHGAYYYPKFVPPGGGDQHDPIHFAKEAGAYGESVSYNPSYQQQLGVYARLGIDPFLPSYGELHPTRIRFSRERLQGGYTDGYIQWDLESYKDFDIRLGEINYIAVESNRLFSVQDKGINYHFVRDRAMIGSSIGNQLLIGEGEVLSDKVHNLTQKYGGQHRFGVIEGRAGFYGVDAQKRVIWRLAGSSIVDLGHEWKFRKDIHEIIDQLSDHSDVAHRLDDAAVCVAGIAAWSDPKYDEVGFTFVFPGSPRIYNTICLDEKGFYAGKRTHHSPFYLKINNDLFSSDPDQIVAGTPTGRFYRHDSNTAYTVFFGKDPEASLAFVASGDRGEKIFEAVALFGSQHPLQKIEARTEFLTSVYDPFLHPQEWRTPEYKENAWRVPHLRTDTTTAGQDLDVDGKLRGNFLRTELFWDTDEKIELATAVTVLQHSYV